MATRTPTRRLRTGVLAVLVAAVLAVEATAVAPTFASALTRLAQSDPFWVALAAASAATSMSFFARLRRRLLAATGVSVRQRDALAAVYEANALHLTLPGGAAFSTACTYRWMRARGASTAAIAWTLVVGGVLSTTALALLGLTGSLLAGQVTGTSGLLVDGVALLLLAGTATLAHRRPDLLAAGAVRAARRVDRAATHRPPGWAEGAVRSLLAQVGAVRPRPADWSLAAACALANWLLDAGCLWAGAAALGVHLSVPVLLLCYTAGMAVAGLSVLPAGIGLVDGAMVLVLTASGLPAATALPVVLLYRLISLVGVVAAGWVVAAVRSPAAPRLDPSASCPVAHAPRGGGPATRRPARAVDASATAPAEALSALG